MNDDLHIPNDERRSRGRKPLPGNKDILPLIVIFIILAGIAAFFFLQKKAEPEKTVTKDIPLETREVGVPVLRHPLPQIETVAEEESGEPEVEKKPLPLLDESDDAIREELSGFGQPGQAESLFLFEALIRHFVVTVDNLTNQKLPQRFGFTHPPAGKFMVAADAYGDIYLDPKNYERYAPFVEFAGNLDNRKLIAVYVHYYPLFQEAYESLGYPGRYFNDRLIEVIDHLLDAPVIVGPIKLERPKVYYKFADPELEKLSAGRKIMVRIGPDNASKVKVKLRQIKQILTSSDVQR